MQSKCLIVTIALAGALAAQQPANPLEGHWYEIAQLSCTTGAEVGPERDIKELIFKADRSFTVTWRPFEVYRDYFGTYSLDAKTGSISIQVDRGNYVPPDVKPRGTFRLTEGGKRLELKGLWLGKPRDGKQPAQCGHVFQRRY